MGFGTPSVMYSPLMMAPQAPPRHQAPVQNGKVQNENEKGPAMFQRPASQATSVKAEPGSAMGSMVSAGLVNRFNYLLTYNYHIAYLIASGTF